MKNKDKNRVKKIKRELRRGSKTFVNDVRLLLFNKIELSYKQETDDFQIKMEFIINNQVHRIKGNVLSEYNDKGLMIETTDFLYSTVKELFIMKHDAPNLCKVIEHFFSSTGNYLDCGLYDERKHGRIELKIPCSDRELGNFFRWENQYTELERYLTLRSFWINAKTMIGKREIKLINYIKKHGNSDLGAFRKEVTRRVSEKTVASWDDLIDVYGNMEG